MAAEGGDCEKLLAQFAQVRVDVDVLAAHSRTKVAIASVLNVNPERIDVAKPFDRATVSIPVANPEADM